MGLAEAHDRVGPLLARESSLFPARVALPARESTNPGNAGPKKGRTPGKGVSPQSNVLDSGPHVSDSLINP